MMEKAFKEVYNRFKLHFYRHIFGTLSSPANNLTVMDALTAEIIYALGRPTISEFASVAGISGPNATYRVQSLVKKGYVKRIPSETDRREFHLCVTEKFSEFYAINEEYIELVSKRIAARFPEGDTKRFQEMIEVISAELMPEATLK